MGTSLRTAAPIVIALLATAMAAGCGGHDKQSMRDLLSDKSNSSDIKSLRLHATHNRDIVIDDVESVSYLSTAFRQSKALGFSTTYKLPRMRADVVFCDGSRSRVSLTLHDASTLIMRFPEDSMDDGEHYSIGLHPPIPALLAGALRAVD